MKKALITWNIINIIALLIFSCVVQGCKTITPTETILEQREVIAQQEILVDNLEDNNKATEEILLTFDKDPRIDQLLLLNEQDRHTIYMLRETNEALTATNNKLTEDLGNMVSLEQQIKSKNKTIFWLIIVVILLVTGYIIKVIITKRI